MPLTLPDPLPRPPAGWFLDPFQYLFENDTHGVGKLVVVTEFAHRFSSCAYFLMNIPYPLLYNSWSKVVGNGLDLLCCYEYERVAAKNHFILQGQIVSMLFL